MWWSGLTLDKEADDMSDPQPIAWMFRNPDGSVKFVLDDKARAEAWGKNFKGTVIPLYEKPEQGKAATA
jgi:hypothetical protein